MSPEALVEGEPAPEEWAESLSPGAEQDAAGRLLEAHPAPDGEPLFVQLVD